MIHRMVRVATSANATRAIKIHPGAWVGAGVVPAGTPATVGATSMIVPTGAKYITLNIDRYLSALLFQLGKIITVRKSRFARLAGVGLGNQYCCTLAYGHLFYIMRGCIVYLMGDGNTKISGLFIV